MLNPADLHVLEGHWSHVEWMTPDDSVWLASEVKRGFYILSLIYTCLYCHQDIVLTVLVFTFPFWGRVYCFKLFMVILKLDSVLQNWCDDCTFALWAVTVGCKNQFNSFELLIWFLHWVLLLSMLKCISWLYLHLQCSLGSEYFLHVCCWYGKRTIAGFYFLVPPVLTFWKLTCSLCLTECRYHDCRTSSSSSFFGDTSPILWQVPESLHTAQQLPW